MREILFKAKRVDNGEWMYGDLIRNNEHDCAIYDCNEHDDYCGVPVNPDTVCQYTGLRDKNGQRIFEGDKVDYKEDGEVNGANMIVVFDGACFSKKLTTPSGAVFNISFDKLDQESLVVTGNIHDTTEATE